jgi:hypothetical protein
MHWVLVDRMTTKNKSIVLVLIALTALLTVSATSLPSVYAQNVLQPNTPSPRSAADTATFNLKIGGIDYSLRMAQVWVLANGVMSSKTINPVAFLDPQDDNSGVIHISLDFKKGTVRVGDEYTACIKVLEDTDFFGNHVACQKGVVSSVQSNGQGVAPQAVGSQEVGPQAVDLSL